jgi:hypothetical protein
MGTGEYPPAIFVIDINISNSVFKNISSNYSSPYAGAIYYFMNTSGNGHYNFSNNAFINISINSSPLYLSGSFSSLSFSYNRFYNVSSTNEGGVYLFIFYN